MDFMMTQNTFAQNANALMRDWSGTRKQVSLWLDLKIVRDIEALEIIQMMKSKREFRRSVMLGLKIVWELRQGRVDTLLKEFPDVVKLLQIKTTPPPPTDNSDILNEILRNQRLLLERGITADLPPSPIAAQPLSSGQKTLDAPKQITSKQFALPVFDDDDDDIPTVVITKATSDTWSNNFLKGLAGLQ